MSDIVYPAILLGSSYIYVARNPSELCIHSKRVFSDVLERTNRGAWRLLDSAGNFGLVAAWRPIPRFGGLKGLYLAMVGFVFAEPVLHHQRILSLEESKSTIANAVRERFAYDIDHPGEVLIESVRSAPSLAAIMNSMLEVFP